MRLLDFFEFLVEEHGFGYFELVVMLPGVRILALSTLIIDFFPCLEACDEVEFE